MVGVSTEEKERDFLKAVENQIWQMSFKSKKERENQIGQMSFKSKDENRRFERISLKKDEKKTMENKDEKKTMEKKAMEKKAMKKKEKEIEDDAVSLLPTPDWTIKLGNRYDSLIGNDQQLENPKFVPPRWYGHKNHPRRPPEFCWHHEEICEPVELNLLLLHQHDKLMEVEKEIRRMHMRWEKRQKKISVPEVLLHFPCLPKKRTMKRMKGKRGWGKTKKKNTEEEERPKMMIKLEQQRKLDKDLSPLCEKWKKILQATRWTIKEGEKYNIPDLLSSSTRDYLLKHNGEQVKIKDHLCGKHVLLYFLYLPGKYTNNYKFDVDVEEVYNAYVHDLQSKTFDEHNYEFNLDLEEIYNAYNPQGKFEVVFVALGNNEDVFNKSFSRLPGLAIPHNDQAARDFFVKQFAIPPEPIKAKPVLFDPNGKVLLSEAKHAFITFGCQGFPFTEKKMEDMLYEARALWDGLVLEKDKPSLKQLFGEYVISPEGYKVLTSELEGEGKIVGLHFFEVSPMGFRRTKELLRIWKQLNHRQHMKFEIVFINKGCRHISIAKAAFEKEFEVPMPWYSLPSDGTGRRLCRVFKNSAYQWYSCYFVILEPDKYHSMSFFAYEIFKEFGIHAYPFTMERAVILAKSNQQETLVLDQLLSPSAPLCRGGSALSYKMTTSVSELSGKRVILLFATHSCYQSGLFLPALKRMYLEKKGAGYDGNDDFEIIYISLDCDESQSSSISESIQGMPWLIHSFVSEFGVLLVQRVFTEFPPQLPAIAAFGVNGHLETKESNLAFKTEWHSRYPFIQDDMDEEVHKELIHEHKNWVLEHKEWMGVP